jgi:hypothetical protein
MAAALLSWRYPSRLGWLQFKPMRGVVSEVEKTPKKKETPPRRGISSFISAEFSRQPGIGGDRGAV